MRWWAMMVVGMCAVGAAAVVDEGALLREVTDTIYGNGAYNVVTYDCPRQVKLSELGLREAGLKAAASFPLGDEIRIFANRDVMNQAPKARVWINSGEGNRYWYLAGGEGSAEELALAKGEVVVVHTRVTKNDLPWKNPLTPSL
jgi:hypothetical protein